MICPIKDNKNRFIIKNVAKSNWSYRIYSSTASCFVLALRGYANAKSARPDWQAMMLSLQMFSDWIMELSLRSPSIAFAHRNPLGRV